MAKAVFLDFEKDLGEIHKKIEELENKELETGVSENEALTELKRKMRTRTAEIYADLTPWQTAQVARHPNRPGAARRSGGRAPLGGGTGAAAASRGTSPAGGAPAAGGAWGAGL